MIPDFKGRESFTGESWHTAEWPRDMSLDKLKGKKIGIIGNGASAVQILPEILDQGQEVVMFQRTAHYVFPRFQGTYSDTFKAVVACWPFGLLWSEFEMSH